MRTYPAGTHSRNARTLADFAGWTSPGSRSGTQASAKSCQLSASGTRGRMLDVGIPEIFGTSVRLLSPAGARELPSFIADADLDAGDALAGGWSREEGVATSLRSRVGVYLSRTDGYPSVALGNGVALVPGSECERDSGPESALSIRRATVVQGGEETEYTLAFLQMAPRLWMKIVAVSGADHQARKSVSGSLLSLSLTPR